MVEMGDRSGEVGEWMLSFLGLVVGSTPTGPGELRLSERSSCSTCCGVAHVSICAHITTIQVLANSSKVGESLLRPSPIAPTSRRQCISKPSGPKMSSPLPCAGNDEERSGAERRGSA